MSIEIIEIVSENPEVIEIISQGPPGPAGPTGPTGAAGQGVPVGGTTGQVLAKASNTNYDTEWVDQSGGGGGASVSDAAYDSSWNGVTTVAPSKNAVYDKIESLDAAKQNLDSDLTAIAGLSPSNDDIIQRKAGTWVNRTPAQLKTDLSLTKSDVGLGNVDNTSDANKPVSTATQTALDAKQPLDSDLTSIAGLSPSNDDIIQRKAGAWTNRTPAQLKTDLALTKSDVGLGNVDNTSDANKPISTATQTALDAKQPLDSDLTTIAALSASNDDIIQRKAGAWINRTPAQFKTDLSLTKSDVGLGSVDNTSDLDKPVSTATQTALNLKVTGPASATDNNIAVYDSTTGKLIKDGAKPIASLDKKVITFVVDGGGTAITTGLKSYLRIPQACTITKWTLLADVSGSIVIDILKGSFGSFPSGTSITASAKPTLSSSQSGESSTLTGWTTSINAGEFLAFNVDSVATVTRVTLELEVTNT